MDEIPEKEFPWGPVVAGAIVVVMIILGIWISHAKQQEKEQEATMAALDQELAGDERAVKEERAKVENMTKSLEDLRAAIQTGQVKDKKAAVDEFNKKAAEQRTERQTFIQMADQYNQKVAKYRDLQK